jgi:hypothetical protein
MAFGPDILGGGVRLKLAIRQSDIAYAEETLKAVPNGALAAIRAAINDALRYARTRTAKGIKADLELKYGDILERIDISRKASRERLSGIMSVDYKPVPLIDFKAKWRKSSGVTAAPFKGEAPIKLGHAFTATMKSGHKGVFLRRRLPVFTRDTDVAALKELGFADHEARSAFSGPAGASDLIGKGIRKQKRLAFGGNFPAVSPQGFAWRLPVDEVMGPPVVAVFGKPAVQDPIVVDISDYFHKRLLSKIDWQLSKAKPNPPESA